MSAAEAVATDRLAAIDDRLQRRSEPMLSLGASRSRAPLPSELIESLRSSGDDAAFVEALVDGVEAVYEAILRAFPHNLFWDMDALFAAVLCEARGAPGQAEAADVLHHRLGAVARLQDVFGRGPINFRYIHDFVYGFDWAKWVAREPAERATVGPFDEVFIAAMHARGRELLDVIERDVDEKYPPLRGEGARNPFGFSREPQDEIRLHRELALRGLIPVAAWTPNPDATWDRPYADLRAAVAAELGLTGD
jgi:hypothetical protein